MVTVREVLTKKDLKQFVTFPLTLYKDCPYFVPPLLSDDYSDWDRKKNPAFSYVEAKCFLAERDGKVVGRIGAILSHRSNERWQTNRMRFTQVDFIDDKEVSRALFDAVEAYAKEKECVEIHGPLGFSDLDREGMLVEGFEERSLFYTYYNYPYYLEHMKALGYEKDVDWLEYKIFCPPEGSRQAEFLHRLSMHSLKRNHLHIATVKHQKDFKPYIEQAFRLVNVAYGELYSVVELDEEQIRRYADKFVPLIDPDFACVVLDEKNEVVAFGATAPDLSRAFRSCGGKLFPFGFIPVLHALKHNDVLDMFLIAVRPDLQGVGLNGIIIDSVMVNACRRGIKYAETGPELEENAKMVTQWSMFDKVQHKRRRCFIKKLN
ncbi:MAG: hypothetical protein MJ078_00290 [Clostridia bacterium]|nr:hypothetical protein [Clostridia bacterium]